MNPESEMPGWPCMKHAQTPLRPGMTAIAAVLAMTSTPLLAQAIDGARATEAAPAVVAPPSPVSAIPETPSAVAAQPSTASVGAPAAGAAQLNIPKITVNLEEPAPTETAPAAPVETPVVRTRSETVRTAEPAPVITPRAATPAANPAAPAPVTAQEAQLPPLVIETPNAPAQTRGTDALVADDTAQIVAGVAGLGALALASGAYALSRRKRRPSEEAYTADTIVAPRAEPVPVPQPAREPTLLEMARAAPPAPASAPLAPMPNGFDTSRYGRHVQAAYRGPTPENPSLSLKRRLKRATFFDQRERMAANAGVAPAATPTPVDVPATQTASRWSEQSMGNRQTKVNFRPVFQS